MRERLLPGPALLPPQPAPAGGHRAEAWQLRSIPQGPDGAVSALAGQIRAPARRGAAHWAHPVRREEPGADRAIAAGQGRDQGGRVPGGAAAQGDAGGQAARGHTAGERAIGERHRDLKGYMADTGFRGRAAFTSSRSSYPDL